MNYIVETFPTIAFECLLTINAVKNVIAFAFTYGFLPWVTSLGYGGVRLLCRKMVVFRDK